MEACKAMARGIGYAGEGDVLTASITGALMRGFKDATFVEIFCPDWKGNTLHLSHMGEYNPALTSGKNEMKKISFIFGEADDPIVGYGCYKAGKAVFTNVFKDADGKYTMLISPVEMVDCPDDNFVGSVRGWMRPLVPVSEFLERISSCGVTHHSSLTYGATVSEMKFFAEVAGLRTVVVG
jgi:L-arabinose isomerase